MLVCPGFCQAMEDIEIAQHLHMIGNLPIRLTSKLATALAKVNKTSKMTPFSSVDSSSFVLHT